MTGSIRYLKLDKSLSPDDTLVFITSVFLWEKAKLAYDEKAKVIYATNDDDVGISLQNLVPIPLHYVFGDLQ